MTHEPVERVVIVGGGTAGWMAAAVLARAFSGRLTITLVESDAIGTVGVGEATIPQIRLLNQYLGIDEDDFIRATGATFKLGIEFVGWARRGDRYHHAFGDVGLPLGGAPFQHAWARARAEGLADDLWAYSLNAQAADQNRFQRMDTTPDGRLQGLRHAFHFDAGLYGQALRRYGEAKGVTRLEGRITQAPLDGETGHVQSVVLDDGRTVPGDLFIDCSGFRGLLIEGALKTGYEDWRHWLPCDRAIAVPSEGGPMRPFTQSIAHEAGWQWRIPLQHRTGNGHVFCSDHISSDEATARLLDGLEGAPLAEPAELRFTTGMRRQVWRRNVVALGLASGFMEPLESTSIHLVQSGISRLVQMFPGKAMPARLRDLYNRETRFEFEAIRDFLILHYHANEKAEPFWRACAAMDVPDTLLEKIDIFRQTGQIHRRGEELFTDVGWLQVLVGQHILPKAWSPLVDAVDSARLKTFLDRIRQTVTATVDRLPDHAETVSRIRV
ncbi:tryptophan halogenase family protein [Yunchengibacter salinarum]|uniref:tryptophan halogenase family protein n=1 Tax=Yunchengibacter salinarum TaxID=3133399 RepID=UPI0035B6271B